MDILENLEFVPTEGTYAVPYVANAAGILYNKDMFEENGWQIPTTWDEFLTLLDTIQESGQQLCILASRIHGPALLHGTPWPATWLRQTYASR